VAQSAGDDAFVGRTDVHAAPWLLLAQAVGSPEGREVAEQMFHLMQHRPGAWQLVLAMLRPAVRDTMS
jgi:hypothetical protein